MNSLIILSGPIPRCYFYSAFKTDLFWWIFLLSSCLHYLNSSAFSVIFSGNFYWWLRYHITSSVTFSQVALENVFNLNMTFQPLDINGSPRVAKFCSKHRHGLWTKEFKCCFYVLITAFSNGNWKKTKTILPSSCFSWGKKLRNTTPDNLQTNSEQVNKPWKL